MEGVRTIQTNFKTLLKRLFAIASPFCLPFFKKVQYAAALCAAVFLLQLRLFIFIGGML